VIFPTGRRRSRRADLTELHQIAPAQIQDCNLVQIPPSEIAPISTELHQTALNCTDFASKPFLHRRKHPFPMTIDHQGGSSQIKVRPVSETGRFLLQ
jgi:hypothetical protein